MNNGGGLRMRFVWGQREVLIFPTVGHWNGVRFRRYVFENLSYVFPTTERGFLRTPFRVRKKRIGSCKSFAKAIVMQLIQPDSFKNDKSAGTAIRGFHFLYCRVDYLAYARRYDGVIFYQNNSQGLLVYQINSS